MNPSSVLAPTLKRDTAVGAFDDADAAVEAAVGAGVVGAGVVGADCAGVAGLCGLGGINLQTKNSPNS